MLTLIPIFIRTYSSYPSTIDCLTFSHHLYHYHSPRPSFPTVRLVTCSLAPRTTSLFPRLAIVHLTHPFSYSDMPGRLPKTRKLSATQAHCTAHLNIPPDPASQHPASNSTLEPIWCSAVQCSLGHHPWRWLAPNQVQMTNLGEQIVGSILRNSIESGTYHKPI